MGLVIHIDGGARGNPGPAGAGVVIRTDAGRLIHEGGYFLGRQTNNAAEYTALIRALQRVQRLDNQAITICSDSELLVRQLTGTYRVKSRSLARLFEQAQRLLLKVVRWSVRHIPREENGRADQLANLAMDRQRDVLVFDVDAPSGNGDGRDPLEPAVTADSAPVDPAAEPHHAAEVVAEQVAPGDAAVLVRVTRGPAPDTCPAGLTAEPFTVGTRLPQGLCVHAAHGILPTLLAMLNTEPQEFGLLPTLTVRCGRTECRAVFQLSPVRSPNGSGPAQAD